MNKKIQWNIQKGKIQYNLNKPKLWTILYTVRKGEKVGIYSVNNQVLFSRKKHSETWIFNFNCRFFYYDFMYTCMQVMTANTRFPLYPNTGMNKFRVVDIFSAYFIQAHSDLGKH